MGELWFSVFFDEADILTGNALLTFMGQLRAGYIERPTSPFPSSVALIGMRPLRDYLVQTRADEDTMGSASPFNIARPLTLSNFTEEEIASLYSQHSEASGQIFEKEAVRKAWYWSDGQPWLVNALAKHSVEAILKKDWSTPVTAEHIDKAAEFIIATRSTHIDSLMARLSEPRIRRVMEPVILGDSSMPGVTEDDEQLTKDLGLQKYDTFGKLTPANRIYGEAIIRTLTRSFGNSISSVILAKKWMDETKVFMTPLIKTFQEFWREISGSLPDPFNYKEAHAHLIFLGFLQKLANGGAHIIREYALGNLRLDTLVNYKGANYPVELKRTGHATLENVKKTGIEQISKYMDLCGSPEGWLAIFDQRKKADSWTEKLYWTTNKKYKKVRLSILSDAKGHCHANSPHMPIYLNTIKFSFNRYIGKGLIKKFIRLSGYLSFFSVLDFKKSAIEYWGIFPTNANYYYEQFTKYKALRISWHNT